jgi:hypothetical protein
MYVYVILPLFGQKLRSYNNAGVIHLDLHTGTRVARWYIFRPKIAIWVNFEGSCNGRYLYILWPFVYFKVV